MAKIQIGLNLPQFMGWDDLIERTAAAERHGYHSLWTCDHMWPPADREGEQLEVLTTMAAIAARTERLRIGTLVICNSFRNPALLAKALTSVDNISHGRLEIGIGAGWMKREYQAYGYEFPSMGVRLKQFEEGLQIIKLLTGDRAAGHVQRAATTRSRTRPTIPGRPRNPIRRSPSAAAARR